MVDQFVSVPYLVNILLFILGIVGTVITHFKFSKLF